VTCRKGGGFIQKKKLCPAINSHHGPLSSFEVQHARDPCLVFKRMRNLLLLIMNNTTITHE
jgi:hypothetical protein